MGRRITEYTVGNSNNSALGNKGHIFNLAFGFDAVIPVEIGINSLRVADYNFEQNEANLRSSLDLLEEIREETNVKAAARKKRVAQYFNKQVKAKTFE